MDPDSVSDIKDVNMCKRKPLKLNGIKESMRQKKAFTDTDLM